MNRSSETELWNSRKKGKGKRNDRGPWKKGKEKPFRLTNFSSKRKSYLSRSGSKQKREKVNRKLAVEKGTYLKISRPNVLTTFSAFPKEICKADTVVVLWKENQSFFLETVIDLTFSKSILDSLICSQIQLIPNCFSSRTDRFPMQIGLGAAHPQQKFLKALKLKIKIHTFDCLRFISFLVFFPRSFSFP